MFLSEPLTSPDQVITSDRGEVTAQERKALLRDSPSRMASTNIRSSHFWLGT